ncbi:hypothetical protein CC80DRAFT_529131 [Byssothecium circinans]|uniref:Mis12-domain-containing protein n=1 Tax=Byssothecium circinans TaxID=147558 RepID=A0A6A5TBU7_9PLEO|nr:hypothetical protein CC80DRAFT_529131 [Byssothecium circinans]
MANLKQQENMLLTEHFSWPPISLLDDIINTINEVLYRCTDTFETGLLSADPALLGFADLYASTSRTPEKDEDGNDVYPEAKLEIEEGTVKLETLMENAVDKNFDRLEIWCLRNVLCLPREEGVGEWMRLGGYENLQIPSKDNTLTPEALQALRRKLVETRKLHTALLAEKTRNEAQIARLRALLQPPPTSTTTAPKRESTSPSKPSNPPIDSKAAPFAFLTHTQAAKDLGIQPLPLHTSTVPPSSSAAPDPRTQPLTTHTTFTTSQLPYLRQLLASLKPHLATAALPTSKAKGEEWARERSVYVESQSKRALERRGVDTRDGVEGGGVLEGGRLRVEEVRGLEGIVGALGRGRKEERGSAEGEMEGMEREGDTGAGAEGDEMDTT